MERYYLGVDWADGFHQIWVSNPDGEKVHEQKLVESVEEFSQFGRRLDEDRAQGIEAGCITPRLYQFERLGRGSAHLAAR